MTVVEGWFADRVYTANEMSDTTAVPPAPIKEVLSENCCINRQAYLVTKDDEGNMLHRPNIIGNKTEGALLLTVSGHPHRQEKGFLACRV